LLTAPQEIRDLRKRLGLTQHAFEKLLGVGPKTVLRWEKGTVFQNRSTDSLLRVIDAVPDSAQFLARLKGMTLPDPSRVATG
jgi:HTH-type transcriptional regulator/antitoxin MqsA